MSSHFDIAVLGTGPGGYIAALKAAQQGAKTAVVEQHPFFGGTCLNWGCIPSKALLASAELIHAIENASAMGVDVEGKPQVNWKVVQKRKDKVLQTLRGGIAGLFKARKITPFHGRATLDGPGKVIVQSDGKESSGFTADKIILAVGSIPSRIPGWPDDPNRVCSSDEALHWNALPKKLLIVGGGVIGCEFACMMAPFGVEATIVEMMPKFLPGMDGTLADALLASLKKRGIRCFVDTKVEELVEKDNLEALLSNGEKIQADKALVATGRRPATADLGLESVNLSTDRGFIRVNDKMETDVKNYYCIGDANGRCLLAHAASAHGVIAANNALGADQSFDAPIPSCVYTFPEVAAVGMTEEQARRTMTPISIGFFPTGHLGKAMAVGDTEGFVKVIRHRETDELLGVHMMGHNVTECIAAAGALLHQKVKVHDVAETVFAHPTISEAMKEAAEDALQACLHLPPKRMMNVAV